MRHVDKGITRELKPVSLYLDNLYHIEAMLQPGLTDVLGGFNYLYKGEIYQAKSVDELVSDFRIAGQEDFNFLKIFIFGLYITLTAINSEVWITLDKPSLREKLIEVIDYLSPLQIDNNEMRDNIHLYNRGSLKDIERLKAIEKSSVIEHKGKKPEFIISPLASLGGEVSIKPIATIIPHKTKKNTPKFLSSPLFWTILGAVGTIATLLITYLLAKGII